MVRSFLTALMGHILALRKPGNEIIFTLSWDCMVLDHFNNPLTRYPGKNVACR